MHQKGETLMCAFETIHEKHEQKKSFDLLSVLKLTDFLMDYTNIFLTYIQMLHSY